MASLTCLEVHQDSSNAKGETSELQLVLAAQGGNLIAFVELSEHHRAKLMRRTYRITRNWADAEDIAQEALIRAFVHLDKFQGRASFSTWLTRIAINLALMRLRKEAAGKLPLERRKDDREFPKTWEVVDARRTPEECLIAEEQQALLRAAILSLPSSLRSVVQLQQTRECSTKEIAKALGITVAAVKSRSSRARLRLRAFLV